MPNANVISLVHGGVTPTDLAWVMSLPEMFVEIAADVEDGEVGERVRHRSHFGRRTPTRTDGR